MHRKIFVNSAASDSEVIRVDGACYHRSCPVEQDPHVQGQDIDIEYAICPECACGLVGERKHMIYQVVAQNVAGWDFARAHPAIPNTPSFSHEERISLCCSVLHSDYQFLAHQRLSVKTLGWDAVRAHPGGQGQRAQHAVHQVLSEDPNTTGFDFVRAHPGS